ncbi:uncharacterized protein LOC135104890 isoform X2 [Scylla paramamosain]|uniref:uncharacterized protein LOC135104890 isoform X2 n=1 Tax=Scylla paramamosain TaxID=85552 RepID=UPI00308291DE
MGESSSDLMEATPPSSPPPVHHSRHHDHGWRGGGSRLAALLRVRRQKLLRQEQEGRRNLSDSESLGGSVRCRCGTHKGLSRNNSTQSAQSAATVHTLVSSSTASSNRQVRPLDNSRIRSAPDDPHSLQVDSETRTVQRINSPTQG